VYRMSNNRHHGRPHREFFTLGEHVIGNRRYSFQYDGRTYRILEQLPEQEETVLLEEADSRTSYDAWNHIKRPERFGGMVVLPEKR